ncbi:hypothetical protein [Yinghuangia sp. YIM S09857]|uniref:hypothetical protein n=1 Tax=Yinghuangia sp. YIM S09857 TaxID=3436929 RepID=UPI003F539DF2
MRRRLRAPVVLVLLLWMFGTACSGPDDPTGLAGEPTDVILDQARTAAKNATAVHITGTWVTQQVEYQIDMRIKTDGATGEIVSTGTRIELLRVGVDLFVRGDESLYQPRDGRQDPDAAASAEVLRDKFVKVPPDDPAFARLSGFTQLHPLLDELFRLEGKVKKDGRKNVRGVETLALAANKGRGGELYVSLGGKPYPMRYSPGPNAGRLDFYEYDTDFPVEVPPGNQVVDYGTLNPAQPPAPGTDAHQSPAPGASGKPSGSPTGTRSPSGQPTSTRSS